MLPERADESIIIIIAPAMTAIGRYISTVLRLLLCGSGTLGGSCSSTWSAGIAGPTRRAGLRNSVVLNARLLVGAGFPLVLRRSHPNAPIRARE
ncbi:hypothetical protein GCM10027444_28430 [Actinopolyspora lacussalsi]